MADHLRTAPVDDALRKAVRWAGTTRTSACRHP